MKADFEAISSEIITHQEYLKLTNEIHHGITRYEHSLRVAKSTYRIAKALKLDYVSATRAALLHDFFVNDDVAEYKVLGKGINHPKQAVVNAKAHFGINAKEENAIITHMFPLTLKMPSTKEGIIVNLADTGVGIYECSKYKLSMTASIWMLFIINIITFKMN